MLDYFKQLTERILAPDQLVRKRYRTFKQLLEADRQAHRALAAFEDLYYAGRPADICRFRQLTREFSESAAAMIAGLNLLAPGRHRNLYDYYRKIDFYLRLALAPPTAEEAEPYLVRLDCRYPDDQLVGGKGMHLAQLATMPDCPVPGGFIITTRAWNRIVAYNDLRPLIDRELARVEIDSYQSLREVSAVLVEAVCGAALPPEIRDRLDRGLEQAGAENQSALYAVRSSAVGEDLQRSFAGQYRSLLNISAESVPEACLQVQASKYSPEAILYRIVAGLDDQSTPMAVAVLNMVDARFSGVLHSAGADPAGAGCTIHFVRGFGADLMAGRATPGTIKASPEAEYSMAAPEEGPAPRVVSELARWSGTIEAYYGVPQEIEWAQDQEGRLWLLQVRALRQPASSLESVEVPEPSLPLLCRHGKTAAPGFAGGRVHRLDEPSLRGALPAGAVLVTENTGPELVALLPRVAAVAAIYGSTADHFSSVAKEFRVPVLVQLREEAARLTEGLEVSVWADRGRVYRGLTEAFEPAGNGLLLPPASPVGEAVKLAREFCTPLGLTDPADPEFRPESCRSLHDVVRFVHEKATEAMFLQNPDSLFRKPASSLLVTDLPLQIQLIDLGDGTRAGERTPARLSLEELCCRPFLCLWRGLSDPRVNWEGHEHFDWQSYDSVALAGGVSAKSDAALSSYCLLSRDYFNLNLRFGYHFTLIDCLCGPVPEENYLLLRFAGGGGTDRGRDLRLAFIGMVLQRLRFTCETSGDLLDGRLMRYEQEVMSDRLEQLGALLGAVRLLDMRIGSEEEIEAMVEAFFHGQYDFSGG